MTYDQTQALFGAMTDLETYAKMHQRELSRDDCDFDAISRYRNYITVSRKNIFDLIQGNQNDT